MRIAVLTANIGGFDEIYPLVKQSEAYELFYYTENTLPFLLPNLGNRMKGKYFKTQAHRFLDHDAFIWIDGSIDVIDGHFVRECMYGLLNNDIVITRHAERKTPYEELVYIIEKMKEGNRYLLKRYAKQPFYSEYDFYKENGLPKDYPLYNCFFFARHNNPKMNALFDMWWDITLRYSNLDQTSFSYVAWHHTALIKEINTKDLFIRHKHPGYNL